MRSELTLKLEPLLKEKAKEKQKSAGGAVPQKSAKAPVETRKEIAAAAKVSHDTIAKVKMILTCRLFLERRRAGKLVKPERETNFLQHQQQRWRG